MHPACGQLRGRGEPDKSQLDRLTRLNPAFKVHWMPVWHDGHPHWVIAEHSGSDAYRAAGAYRVRRFEAEQPDNLPMLYGAILMAEGGHMVGLFTNEEFLTDQMFVDLEQAEENVRQHMAVVEAAQRKVESKNIEEEIERNPALKALAEQIDSEAGDLFRYYIKGQHSVTQLAAPTGVSA